MSSPRKILVAIDGSDQAKYAFDWYLENVHKDGDHVVLAHCAEYNTNLGFPGANPDIEKINQFCEEVKKRSQEIELLTNSYMDILRAKKINAKLTLLDGKPGESIVNACKKEEVNHIIMGTRGLGTIRRTFLGSVSEYLVHHCDVPITIVRK